MTAGAVSTGRTRRCVNRSCGRYFNKVDEGRCVSCGRSTKGALVAPFAVFAKKITRNFR